MEEKQKVNLTEVNKQINEQKDTRINNNGNEKYVDNSASSLPSISSFLLDKTKIIPVLIIFVLVVFCIYKSFYIVRVGTVAVTENLGKIYKKPVVSGIHLRVPFLSRTEYYPTRLSICDIKKNTFTKDAQELKVELTLSYQFVNEHLPSLYQTAGSQNAFIKTLLVPATTEAIHQTFSEIKLEEIFTHRSRITKILHEKTNNFLKNFFSSQGIKYGDKPVINLNTINIARIEPKSSSLKIFEQLGNAKLNAKLNSFLENKDTKDLNDLNKGEIIKRFFEKWDGKLPQSLNYTPPFSSYKLNFDSGSSPRKKTYTPSKKLYKKN